MTWLLINSSASLGIQYALLQPRMPASHADPESSVWDGLLGLGRKENGPAAQ